MRAIVSSADGPVLRDIPRPLPGPEDVLVQVKAGSLNRADLAMLRGSSHGRVGGIGAPLGLEWAGEVVEVGDRVKRWRIGDRVMAAGGGAFAEYAIGHGRRIYPMPNDLPFEQAAALPVALQTMHDAIATNGMLEAGQKVTRALLPALALGALRLPIDKVLPLEEASEAFENMARNQHFGKIVLATLERQQQV